MRRQRAVLIASLLHRALEKAREDLLLAALLLARQITCENHYANYGLWFSTITTSSTNPKHFAFLVEYLSGIARYDTAPVLRAQLGNPPHIPPVKKPKNKKNHRLSLYLVFFFLFALARKFFGQHSMY